MTSGVFILLWLALHADIVLARVNLDPDQAGSYNAAATVTKSITILLALAGTVLLPRVSKSFDDQVFPRRLTIWLAGVLLIGGMLIAVLFSLVGEQLVRLLFGDAFFLGENLLALSMWASVPWIVAAGLINAWMGSRHLTPMIFGLSLIVVCEFIAMTTFGTEPRYLFLIFGLTGIAAAIMALIPLAVPSAIQEKSSGTPGMGFS